MKPRAEKISTIEVVAEPKVGLFERLKNKPLGKTVLFAGALAAAATAATTKPSRAEAFVNQAHPKNTQEAHIAQTKIIGVVTDMAEKTSLTEARDAISFIKQAGFSALSETVWIPTGIYGFGQLDSKDRTRIQNSLQAATEQNLPVNLYMWQEGWVPGYKVPTGSSEQTGFCRVGYDLVKQYPIIKKARVGVEWNNPTFAPVQFINGGDAIAQPYESLMGKCYKLLHQAADERGTPITVVGGELAPTGNDDPHSDRPSHSPQVEINNLCDAYRADKTNYGQPIMDEWSQHWYPVPGETTIVSHPNNGTISIGDYAKLVKAISCFTFPNGPKIMLGEGGIASKTTADYRSSSPNAVDESVQASFVTAAIHEFVCNEPLTDELDNFQLVDDGSALSTGFYYYQKQASRQSSSLRISARAKSSFPTIESAIIATQNGSECN